MLAGQEVGGHIFGTIVQDASRYGVVEIDDNGRVCSLEEKPEKPKSNIAIVGIYFFDNRAVDIAKSIKPSARGELEIVDVIKVYIENESLQLEILPRGLTWLDTGTYESMMQASQYVYAFEERSGVKIACPEEIAMTNGWITKSEVRMAAEKNGIQQLLSIFKIYF